MENICRHNLPDLPNEVLLHIFSYLSLSDLDRLSQSNRRLRAVCRDKSLWREVHDVCNGTSPLHIRLRKFLNESTTSLHISKPAQKSWNRAVRHSENKCFGKNFLRSLRSLSLNTFILKNHTFSSKNFTLRFLPSTLTQLILIRISLPDMPHQSGAYDDLLVRNQIFNHIHTRCPNLEVVDVSHCSWVTPDLLLPLSRCSNLKKLVMVNCRHMRDISRYVSYVTFVTNPGFSNLRTLDLRLTYVTFKEVCIFRKTRYLRSILLEKPAAGRMEAVNRNLRRVGEIFQSFSISAAVSSLLEGPLAQKHMNVGIKRDPKYRSLPALNYPFSNTWLETLVLRNCEDINDSTLADIEAQFTSLSHLDVTGTKCTAERVALLKSRCPQIKVFHDSIVGVTDLEIDLSL